MRTDGAWEATERQLQVLNTGSPLYMVTRIGRGGRAGGSMSQVEVGEEVLSS